MSARRNAETLKLVADIFESLESDPNIDIKQRADQILLDLHTKEIDLNTYYDICNAMIDRMTTEKLINVFKNLLGLYIKPEDEVTTMIKQKIDTRTKPEIVMGQIRSGSVAHQSK